MSQESILKLNEFIKLVQGLNNLSPELKTKLVVKKFKQLKTK